MTKPAKHNRWRPYFVLRTGFARLGYSHKTQKQAWQEIREIFARSDIEWVVEPGCIKEYGIERCRQ